VAADAVHQEQRFGLAHASLDDADVAEAWGVDVAHGGAQQIQPQTHAAVSVASTPSPR